MAKKTFKRNIYGIVILAVIAICIKIFGMSTPSIEDPYFEKQWALNNESYGIDIGVGKIWPYLTLEQFPNTVVIAVIDTGVDFSHPELQGKQWVNPNEISRNHIDDDNNGYIDDFNGWNFIENDNSMQCSSYHGTMCAGIIAANHDAIGIKGITGNLNIQFMSLQILDSNYSVGHGDMESLIKAIHYAEDNGADICNLSLSTKEVSYDLYRTIKSSKMLFVTSAGNSESFRGINIDKSSVYPASYDLPNLITVTSIDSRGKLDKKANYGYAKVQVAAPGSNICVLSGRHTYGYVDGTSYAAAHVSGMAAIIYARDREISASKAKTYICEATLKLASLNEKCQTEGMIYGEKLLKLLLQ